MFCNNCGISLPNESSVCPNCGNVFYHPNGQNPQPFQSPYQNPYQQPYQNPYQQPYQQPTIPQPQLGMKWFKFIIYFQLVVGAILYFSNGVQLLTGTIYSKNGQNLSSFIYKLIPALKTQDVIIGILYILLAVFALISDVSLSKYKKFAPILYLTYLASGIVITIIYLISISMITNNHGINYNPFSNSNIISNLVGCIVLLICNISYFKNRKHLFVN